MCHCCPGYLFGLGSFLCGFRPWYLVRAKVAYLALFWSWNFLLPWCRNTKAFCVLPLPSMIISVWTCYSGLWRLFSGTYVKIESALWEKYWKLGKNILGGCLGPETVPNIVKWRNGNGHFQALPDSYRKWLSMFLHLLYQINIPWINISKCFHSIVDKPKVLCFLSIYKFA